MTGRRIGAVAIAVALAAAIGAGAAAFADDGEKLLAAVVFAACVAPVGYALGWALLVAPVEVPATAHVEDDVEQVWMQRATSGAFLDVITVLGLATAAVSVTRLGDVSPSLLLLLVLVGAMADAAVRYAVTARLSR